MTATRRQRILVVEDERELAEFLKFRLETAGFQVDIALCGKAAISWAVEHQPDLVILDLVLPDMDGHKVCQELRRLYSFWALPVLILTAKNQPIDQLRGFAHGADAYMTKPFESGELLRTVALLVGNTAPA